MIRLEGYGVTLTRKGESQEGFAIFDRSKGVIEIYESVGVMAERHYMNCCSNEEIDTRLNFSAGILEIKCEDEPVSIELAHMDAVDIENFRADFTDAFYGIN